MHAPRLRSARQESLDPTPPPPEPGYDPARPLLVWLLAGYALFSVVSARTGVHITVRVTRTRRASERQWSWFVYGRGGPANPDATDDSRVTSQGGPWFYIGQLFAPKGYVKVVSTQATAERGAAALPAVNWFMARVHLGWDGTDGDVPARLLKSVKCARCKQPLTSPESIARGLGPECWEKQQGGGA